MATEAEIKAAKTKMDNAYAAIAPAKASMDSWYNLMTKCDTGKEVVILGEQYEGGCHNGSANNHPGCAKKETCESNRTSYNASVSNWEGANTSYENAKDEYDTIKGQKGEEDISKIEQDASGIRTRYYVFGGIVIVLIVAAVFVIMKYKK